MGVTNDWGQKAFNRAGSAIFEVYDPVLLAYRRMGRVTGLGYAPVTSKIQQRAPIKGMSRVTQERTTSMEGNLSFTFAEQMAPGVAQLLFGDPSVDQAETAATVTSDIQIKTLYNTDVQRLTNPLGLVPNVDLGTVTSAPAASSTGGTWTAAEQFFWVSAIYGDASAIDPTTSTAAYLAAMDIDFTQGAISVSASVVTSSGDKVTVATIAKSPTAPVPDHWLIWHSVTDDISTAKLQEVLAGSASTSSLLDGPLTTTGYNAGVGIGVQDILAYSTGTATHVKMTSGTDFTYSAANGTIKRVAAGGLVHGEDVRLTVWNYNPDIVQTDVGSPVGNQDTRQVRVTSFEGEVDKVSADNLLAEGERFIFYRVNFSGTTPSYSYTEDDFHEGASVEVNCQYDGSQDKIGIHEGHSRKFANFVQNYA